jgi:hypothetical protein
MIKMMPFKEVAFCRLFKKDNTHPEINERSVDKTDKAIKKIRNELKFFNKLLLIHQKCKDVLFRRDLSLMSISSELKTSDKFHARDVLKDKSK